MDSNNNDNDKTPVRIKKLRKWVEVRLETQDSDMDSIQSHRDPKLARHPPDNRKTVGKKECLECHRMFVKKEGLYFHWEDVHRKYDEEENPNPSPSE